MYLYQKKYLKKIKTMRYEMFKAKIINNQII